MEWIKDLQPIATVLSAIISMLALIVVVAITVRSNKKLEELRSSLIENNSYLSEKGKNVAAKEDIEEITRKIETIRNEYATPTETLKWQLSKRANLHKLQAEKEFQVYSIIWEKVVELKFAAQNLRPSFDIIDPNEPEIEKWNRRYQKITKDYSNLLYEIEKQRPFYPHELYSQLHTLLNKTHDEILDFEYSLKGNEGKMPYEAYIRGNENIRDILENLNKVCDLMRNRINES